MKFSGRVKTTRKGHANATQSICVQPSRLLRPYRPDPSIHMSAYVRSYIAHASPCDYYSSCLLHTHFMRSALLTSNTTMRAWHNTKNESAKKKKHGTTPTRMQNIYSDSILVPWPPPRDTSPPFHNNMHICERDTHTHTPCQLP